VFELQAFWLVSASLAEQPMQALLPPLGLFVLVALLL
jgi:hypothetical protein